MSYAKVIIKPDFILRLKKKLITSEIKIKDTNKGNLIKITKVIIKETTKVINNGGDKMPTIKIDKVLIKPQIKTHNLKLEVQTYKTLLLNSCKHLWKIKRIMKRLSRIWRLKWDN